MFTKFELQSDPNTILCQHCHLPRKEHIAVAERYNPYATVYICHTGTYKPIVQKKESL